MGEVNPSLVQAVLDEGWWSDGQPALFVDRGSDHGHEAAEFSRDDGDTERARQAALGHDALRWLVAYVDSGLCLDSEGSSDSAARAIVAELRGEPIGGGK